MVTNRFSDYVLTVVQHTCCDDCNKLKGKFVEVYNASGISRGEESKHWRVELIAPSSEVQHGTHNIQPETNCTDVPSLKLEADGQMVFDIQDSTLIDELMGRLKWMLIKHESNDQICTQLSALIQHWGQGAIVETATSSLAPAR